MNEFLKDLYYFMGLIVLSLLWEINKLSLAPFSLDLYSPISSFLPLMTRAALFLIEICPAASSLLLVSSSSIWANESASEAI